MSASLRRLAAGWQLDLSPQVQLVAALAGAAWALGAWLCLGAAGGATSSSASPWWCMPGMGLGNAAASSGALGELAAGVPMWLTMTLAMTLPGELPAAEYVAANSFRRSRSSAVAVFLIVFSLVWLSSGIPALALLQALRGLPRDALTATALALAAGYELTTLKRRALDRCHRGAALPPRGARRLAGVARFGWINASGCVASCWPAMLAASIAPLPQALAMPGFALAMTYERLTRRPRTARRRTCLSYVVLSAAFALAAF